MALRISRQITEVGGSGSASIQVSRQAIEVLMGEGASEIFESVASVMSLSQLAVNINTNILVGTASVINFTQQATHNIKVLNIENLLSLEQDPYTAQTFEEDAISEIIFDQEVAHNFKLHSASSILDIDQDVMVQKNDDFFINVFNELDLSDVAALGNFTFFKRLPEGMYTGTVFDPLNIPFDPDDVINLQQNVLVTGNRSLFPQSTMSLQQSVFVKQAVINLAVVQNIILAHQAGRILEVDAENIIALTSNGERGFFPSNTLTLSQLVEVAKGFTLEHNLNLQQLISINVEYLRVLETELGLNHSMTYILENNRIECLYSPQVGTVSSGITPPSTTPPTLGDATLTLTYPFDTPTTTLILRNPIFGNTDSLQFQRIHRDSRGGTLLIFSDPDWPKQQVLSMQVEGLKQVEDLLAFFEESLGQEIGLLDHENRQWRGLLTTPEASVTHVGRKRYSVSFQFEGQLV